MVVLNLNKARNRVKGRRNIRINFTITNFVQEALGLYIVKYGQGASR